MLKKLKKGVLEWKRENIDHNLTRFDHFKSEKLADLRRVLYLDPEYMVQKLDLTYDEIMAVLDIKYTSAKSTG